MSPTVQTLVATAGVGQEGTFTEDIALGYEELIAAAVRFCDRSMMVLYTLFVAHL